MVIFFMFFIWLMILWRVFGDLFRRRDIDGGLKVAWFAFVIVLPFLGVFVYLLSQGHKMADRDMEHMQAAKAQQDAHIKSVAGSSAADQITRAKQLLDSGAITQAEFDTIKRNALV
jgi:uncharacterized membrane protein